jgi:hypothetical protein
MEKIIADNKAYVFDINDVPATVNNIALSEADRQNLAQGKTSSLLPNMKHDNGEVADTKIFLKKNLHGGTEICFKLKKQVLLIPDEIGGVKLSKQQLADLEQNMPVLIKLDGKDRIVQIDKELNKISVKSLNEIGIPQMCGKYELTDKDKLDLAAGKSMPPRMFENNGQYFIAKLALTQDNKGLVFSDIKDLQIGADIDKLKTLLNTDAPKIDAAQVAIQTASQSVSENVKGTDNVKGTENLTNDAIFIKHIDSRDYEQVKKLSDINPPSKFVADYVDKNVTDRIENNAIKAACNIPIKSFDTVAAVANDAINTSKVDVKLDAKLDTPDNEIASAANNRKNNTIGKLGQQAFGDM